MKESARLADQLCFSLYAASRALASAYRRRLAPLGLTYPQYLTLLALWEEDGRSVQELGAVLQLDSGTLSPLLHRLEQAGLIRRERGGRDGRAVSIFITDKGAALESPAAQVRRSVEASTGLNRVQMEELRSALVQLDRSVRS